MGAACCKNSIRQNEALLEAKSINTQSSGHIQYCQFGVAGIDDLGGTSYVNVVLQCLSHCEAFHQYFISTNVCITSFKLSELIKRFVWIQWTQTYGSIIISELNYLVASEFNTPESHDPKEFLKYLINGLDSEIEDFEFYKMLQTTVKIDTTCQECNFVHEATQKYMFLSLPLSHKVTTLEKCLETYLNSKNIDWNCRNCDKTVIASRKRQILELPSYLVFHLKRFDKKKKKNNCVVDYKLYKFGVDSFVTSGSSSVYNLFGVVSHDGTFADGHYNAAVLHRVNHTWHLFDDENVSKLDFDDVKSKNACMLWYRIATKSPKKDCVTNAQPIEPTNDFKNSSIKRQCSEEVMSLLNPPSKYFIKNKYS